MFFLLFRVIIDKKHVNFDIVYYSYSRVNDYTKQGEHRYIIRRAIIYNHEITYI